MWPDREDCTPGEELNKADDTPRKEIPPTKASVNLTIREDWGDETNYGVLMSCKVAEGTAFEQQHALIQSGGHINPTWVLLDNQYTVEVFSSRSLLNNIRKSNRSLAFLSTGGRTTNDLQGDLRGYGRVWFHPGGIAKILSLSKVADKYRVSYDSTGENKFLVHLPRGKLHILQNARGVSSTTTWLQGKRCSSIL